MVDENQRAEQTGGKLEQANNSDKIAIIEEAKRATLKFIRELCEKDIEEAKIFFLGKDACSARKNVLPDEPADVEWDYIHDGGDFKAVSQVMIAESDVAYAGVAASDNRGFIVPTGLLLLKEADGWKVAAEIGGIEKMSNGADGEGSNNGR